MVWYGMVLYGMVFYISCFKRERTIQQLRFILLLLQSVDEVLRVKFPHIAGEVSYNTDKMDSELTLAYAITIHKSQVRGLKIRQICIQIM